MDKNLSDFFYTSFESGQEPRKFEGLAAGGFTDMWGRDVSFSAADLVEISSRTKAVLASKRAVEGEDFAGLPIEGKGHFSGDAVGWIVDVELSSNGQVIDFVPVWTAEGKRILETKERRYFSPTVAMLGKASGEKIIIAGTLTNWPAIRDENDLPLMKPVALSDGRFTFGKEPEDKNSLSIQKVLGQLVALLQPGQKNEENQTPLEGDNNMEKLDVKVLLEAMTPEDKAEFISALALEADGDVAKLIGDHFDTALQAADGKVATIVTERVNAELQKREVTSFAKALVGGGEIGLGLPVKEELLIEFTQSLSSDQLGQAREIFSAIQTTGLIDFQEKGSSKKEEPGTKELSTEMKAIVRSEIARGISLERFFEANDDLGKMSDYDLSEFLPKESKEEKKD